MTMDDRDRRSAPTTHTRFLKIAALLSGSAIGTGLFAACGAQPTAPAAKPAEPAKPADTAKPAADAKPTAAQAAPAAPQPTAKPVVTAAAAAPAGAAAPKPAPAAAGKEPKRGGTLKLGINQESATIDPHKSKDIAGTQIKGLVYSQLLKYYHGRQLVRTWPRSSRR